MNIILLERVPKLGQIGDVVQVRPGFARNFLLPQKKALRATEANKAAFEKRKAQLLADNLKLRQEAEKIAKKVDGLSVVVIRQAGETGMLYGSVSPRDIADAVTAKGAAVSRQQIAIHQPIKTLGLFPIEVFLHPEVMIKITVNVARNEEEAAVQAKTGAAVVLAAPEAAETPATSETKSA